MKAVRAWRCLVARVIKIAALATAGIFLGPAAEEAGAVPEIIYVRNDSTGGDCTRVGVWNASSKTCTLATDFNGKFIIDGNGITLDGAGHTVSGTGPENPADFVPGPDGGGDAVLVYGKTGVTVRNLVIARFDYSVDVVYSSDVTVTGIRSSLTGLAGISLSHATHNTITGNTISNAGLNTGICIGYESTDNKISGNSITGSERGIYLHTNCDRNVVSGNILADNAWGLTLWEIDADNTLAENTVNGGVYGIFLHGDSNNAVVRSNTVQGSATGIHLEGVSGTSVYNNSFIGNASQARAVDAGTSYFNLASPTGGNYWSDFDLPAEGCQDANGDGFCDAAYIFDGGQDALAWTQPEGWVCRRPDLSLDTPKPFWGSYSDYRQRLLSLTWTINNRGVITAQDVLVTGGACTNGVMVETPLPAPLGNIGGGQSLTGMLRYHVPSGVYVFRATMNLCAADTCGGVYVFPPPAVPGA